MNEGGGGKTTGSSEDDGGWHTTTMGDGMGVRYYQTSDFSEIKLNI